MALGRLVGGFRDSTACGARLVSTANARPNETMLLLMI